MKLKDVSFIFMKLFLSLSEFQDRWMTEGWGRVLEVSVFSTDRYLKAYGFV